MKGMKIMSKYWIWFSKINEIGARKQNELLKKYKQPKKIWSLTKEELEQNINLEQKDIEIILDNKYRKDLEKHIEYMQKNDIKILTIQDKNYPYKLKNIYDPPVVVYIKGNEKILNNKSLAIIGSRMCSNYGKNITESIAYNLSKYNINIVSGLARGIDTCAHIGTIRANMPTIAVMGCGLDIVYPSENKKIFDSIVKNGAIISEYAIGTKPEKSNFPARNRIISGLSDGVLVVEASRKSGTFITVDFALEQGKNIYAIPRKYK